MFAIFFYSIASLLLSIMIINANEPVMDLSQLVQPTATLSSFPPIPVPAALTVSSSPDDSASSSSSSSSQDDFGSILSDYNHIVKNILHNSNSNKKQRLSFFSWPWWRQVRATASSRQRISNKKHHRETRPRHSRYSPPAQAAYSREEYEEYSQRQTSAFNKSGFCDKVASPHSEPQELLTSPLPAALPNKS